MRILTLNLLAELQDWPARAEILRSGLRTLDADILALQETVVRPGHDQVADLLSEDYHVVHGAIREVDGTGMSIASRWPIRDSWDGALPRSARIPEEEFCHQLLAVLVEPPDMGPVLVASPKPTFRVGHEVERETMTVVAARAVEDVLEECHAAHVVLASDFDGVPDSASMRFWRGLQSLGGFSVAYADALEVVHGATAAGMWTFDPQRNALVSAQWRTGLPRQIDHVLVRCGPKGPTLEIRDARVVLDEPVGGVWASDHFGVLATLAEPASA
jgi:endonuclease/exonuclease/phosphatase family metal-dependent hydrolase